ncbi:hypothetical protein FQK02_00525 [Xanthomonas vasicola]|uniref:hypothetical protein n=1 Tax=Xanthomonas vasicola TaxID=56459 RepID=UPI0001CBEF1A|nr:hypothetical protein [Xanthomonas vasicola]MBV6748392.1 hypothetical protein [Xanthomonas vasicola pv. vasculorum NCPPB 890]MBV6894255.1 hypothetical protein [Xanthomonas vasicola pv. vasculorum]MDO6950190.1 hypothetical protein [Xanthomonas vasicola]MDO6954099.1 hypothetical protein [Xanthomonas vasicola]MDO6962252.1 hypothetical protein [Xanthomonas vasicola]
MISDDIPVLNQVFSVIDSAIADDYDYFCAEFDIGEGYVDRSLVVKRGEDTVIDDRIGIDDVKLYRLVKILNENAKARGECWVSFTMCYKKGHQVKTNFKY